MSSVADPIIIAVDLGTSGVKVALMTHEGKRLAWETEPVALHVSEDGGAEQSPEEWWQALLTATKRAIARTPGAAARVRAVCCSTQGEGTVAVDRDGNALMNAIIWMDMRGAPYVQANARGFVNIAGAAPHKLWRWLSLTGGMPSLSGKDPAGHMLLVRERFPQVYERTYKFLNVLDYLNLRLCGEFAATFDSILTSWVTDNRDPDNVRYHDALIAQSGIDGNKLPTIVPCTAVLGRLRPSVAEALGLSAEVQVVAGAIDNTAAAVGAGTVRDYEPHLYIGTSSWISAHVPFKKTDLFAYLASTPCAVPGRYLLTALQATAGGNLNFLRDNILYHKDALLREAHTPDVFKLMDQIAEQVPAGSNGVLYTPWIWGERAPVEDRTLRAGLYNLSLNNTRADIIRAVLEGVALNTRWLMQPVERFLKRSVKQMRIVGGGAASDIWCQIFADVLNCQIDQMEDPIQANARGAAFIGAVGLGLIRYEDVPELVPVRRSYTPTPQHRRLYDERFATFVEVYQQMHKLHRRWNGVS